MGLLAGAADLRLALVTLIVSALGAAVLAGRVRERPEAGQQG
ncbi:hypothetical protein [Streptomyces vastus]